MQLVVVAFASGTVFLRTRWHPLDLEDGRNLLSYLFYSAYFMNATGWSELSITVRTKLSGACISFACIHLSPLHASMHATSQSL